MGDNPNAFPGQPLGSDGLPTWEASPGMTLRDWFAGHALPSVIDAMQRSFIDDHPTAGGGPAGFAATAYDIADAMLVARTPAQPVSDEERGDD